MLDMYIHIDGILFTIGQSEFEMLQTSMLLRPELSQLSPYNAGLTIDDVAKRCGNRSIAKLGSNENPFGHAPEVRAFSTYLRAACCVKVTTSQHSIRRSRYMRTMPG
jgi:hypothetical protein